jgi:hypothetical protein
MVDGRKVRSSQHHAETVLTLVFLILIITLFIVGTRGGAIG